MTTTKIKITLSDLKLLLCFCIEISDQLRNASTVVYYEHKLNMMYTFVMKELSVACQKALIKQYPYSGNDKKINLPVTDAQFFALSYNVDCVFNAELKAAMNNIIMQMPENIAIIINQINNQRYENHYIKEKD